MHYLKTASFIIFCCISSLWATNIKAESIYDEARNRAIPIEVTFPKNKALCTNEFKCPVVFLSAGYGVSHLKYTFLSTALNQLGYLVVAIGHELPTDPPLSISGDLYETRSENWCRGAQTLDFLQRSLSKGFINLDNNYDFEKLTLLGHSNGGDISAWLANENKAYIHTVITLDHRRVPLPRSNHIKVLSIRASDFPADEGVLPTVIEQEKYKSCIINIPKAKHNDIADFGPLWLKKEIKEIISGHFNGQPCITLKKALFVRLTTN